MSVAPINLSNRYFHTDSLALMAAQAPGFCDHIISEPDIATWPTPVGAWETMEKFWPLAFHSISQKGFVILFDNLHVHERLLGLAEAAGFEPQFHPLIWNPHSTTKMGDFKSPFPLTYYTMMVACKPGTIMARRQRQPIFNTVASRSLPNSEAPYAKPKVLWKWLYYSVAAERQIVYDPFLGFGSSAPPAIDLKLWHLGSELDHNRFAFSQAFIKSHYTERHGPTTEFC